MYLSAELRHETSTARVYSYEYIFTGWLVKKQLSEAHIKPIYASVRDSVLMSDLASFERFGVCFQRFGVSTGVAFGVAFGRFFFQREGG